MSPFPDIWGEDFCPKRVLTKRMTTRTVEEYKKQADRYLTPALGKLDIDKVKRHHMERMVEPLRPVLRNRVLALASRIFRYFEDQGLRRQHNNPCRGVERSREEPRDRTLNPTEITAFGKALAVADIDAPSCNAIHRRTFMTRAAESGIGSHTLRDLLGHKTATMADRYIRRANIPVVDATEAISGTLAAMMNGSQARQISAGKT